MASLPTSARTHVYGVWHTLISSIVRLSTIYTSATEQSEYVYAASGHYCRFKNGITVSF
jgi:hypothetical protein